jgi:hypothetical protein
LQSTRELLAEEIHPLSAAEAYERLMLDAVGHAEATEKAIELSSALARQQEHFREDFKEFQRQMVETLGKLQKTGQAMEAMHKQQFALATQAGLSVEQLQQRVEAEGYDPNPLKWVLYSSSVMGLDSVIQRSFKFPDAANGSDLAQHVKHALIQGVMQPHLERLQAEAAAQQAKLRMTAPKLVGMAHATVASEREEERELKRRHKAARMRQAQQEREVEAFENQEAAEFGGRSHADNLILSSVKVVVLEDEE